MDTSRAFKAGVRYADLDAVEPCWQELIPPFPFPLLHFHSCLEPIANAPVLTIHLAISIGRECVGQEGSGETGVEVGDVMHEILVWRICPAYDKSGVIVGLQADLISTFCHSLPDCRRVRSLKLQGPNLIFSQNDPFSTCSVIRWAEANGCRDTFPRKVIAYPGCYVCVFFSQVQFSLIRDPLLEGSSAGRRRSSRQ